MKFKILASTFLLAVTLFGAEANGSGSQICRFSCPDNSESSVACPESIEDCKCISGFKKEGEDCICDSECPANSKKRKYVECPRRPRTHCRCDNGYSFERGECVCSSECPENSRKRRNVGCPTSARRHCKCNKGFVQDGDKCSPECDSDFRCPKNFVATTSCPQSLEDCACRSGFTMGAEGVCVCDKECPANSVLKASVDCPKNIKRHCECAPGFKATRDKCRPDCVKGFKCPANSTPTTTKYDCNSFLCECNEGFEKIDGECIPCDFKCPENSERSVNDGQCVASFDDCQCIKGFRKVGASCKAENCSEDCANPTYKYESSKDTWENHDKRARASGCNLASIHSDEELAEINALYRGEWFYIGGSRRTNNVVGDGKGDQNWMWSDGTCFDFEKWYPGEPNNFGGVEDVSHLGFFEDKDQWNDIRGDHQLAAVYKCCSSSLYVYEPFGDAPSLGFDVGSTWAIKGSLTANFDAPGLSYTDSTGNQLTANGGALSVTDINGSSQISRKLSKVIWPSTSPYWMSFLIRLDSEKAGDGFWTPHELKDLGGAGFQDGNLRFVDGPLSGVPVTTSSTNLVVVHVEKDFADLWVDPVLERPGDAMARVNGQSYDLIHAIFKFSEENAGAYTIDEIRVGLTFLEVTPRHGAQEVEFCSADCENPTYRYESTLDTWENHEKKAREDGCNLASIHSEAELATINALYRGEWFYVGGSRRGTNPVGNGRGAQNWMWSDGTCFDFEKWYPGEPNNFGAGEDVSHLGFFEDKDLWNDIHGDNKLAAVYKCCT